MSKRDDLDYARWLFTTNSKAVERAILTLYNLQTSDEKNENTTKYRNGCGFSVADAPMGNYLARRILSGRPLSDTFLDQGKLLALKYVKQLQKCALQGTQSLSTHYSNDELAEDLTA